MPAQRPGAQHPSGYPLQCQESPPGYPPSYALFCIWSITIEKTFNVIQNKLSIQHTYFLKCRSPTSKTNMRHWVTTSVQHSPTIFIVVGGDLIQLVADILDHMPITCTKLRVLIFSSILSQTMLTFSFQCWYLIWGTIRPRRVSGIIHTGSQNWL